MQIFQFLDFCKWNKFVFVCLFSCKHAKFCSRAEQRELTFVKLRHVQKFLKNFRNPVKVPMRYDFLLLWSRIIILLYRLNISLFNLKYSIFIKKILWMTLNELERPWMTLNDLKRPWMTLNDLKWPLMIMNDLEWPWIIQSLRHKYWDRNESQMFKDRRYPY